jgi:hypothetical protein
VSDELIKSLQRRVNELESETINLKAEAKDRRVKGKKLSEENETLKGTVTNLSKDRDDWKSKAETSAPELAAKVSELEGMIRVGTHRKAFDTAAAAQGVRPEAIDDLWTLSGYKAEGDTPDPAAISSTIETVKAAKSYLFQPAEGQGQTEKTVTTPPVKTKLDVVMDNGRGGGNIQIPGFRVTKANSQDYTWMKDNASKINEARKAGTLIMED